MMDSIELKARQDMVRISHAVHRAGLVTATDGNLSIRLDEQRILITPSSLRKEEMTLEAPVVIDYDGNMIGAGRASSERKIHLKAYHERPEVNAVIHAHPIYSIALTVAGKTVDTCLLPEIVVSLGSVPVAPYATPSTDDLPWSMDGYVQQSDVIMLERHGSLTVGKDLDTAYKLLEKLEQSAQICFYANLLGGAVPFSIDELERLQGLRDFYGADTAQLVCALERRPVGGVSSVRKEVSTAASSEPSGVAPRAIARRTWPDPGAEVPSWRERLDAQNGKTGADPAEATSASCGRGSSDNSAASPKPTGILSGSELEKLVETISARVIAEIRKNG